MARLCMMLLVLLLGLQGWAAAYTRDGQSDNSQEGRVATSSLSRKSVAKHKQAIQTAAISPSCVGRVTAIVCHEDPTGQLKQVAYLNTNNDLQLVGCATGVWGAGSTRALFLQEDESVIAVKTCRKQSSLESATFFTDKGNSIRCGPANNSATTLNTADEEGLNQLYPWLNMASSQGSVAIAAVPFGRRAQYFIFPDQDSPRTTRGSAQAVGKLASKSGYSNRQSTGHSDHSGSKKSPGRRHKRTATGRTGQRGKKAEDEHYGRIDGTMYPHEVMHKATHPKTRAPHTSRGEARAPQYDRVHEYRQGARSYKPNDYSEEERYIQPQPRVYDLQQSKSSQQPHGQYAKQLHDQQAQAPQQYQGELSAVPDRAERDQMTVRPDGDLNARRSFGAPEYFGPPKEVAKGNAQHDQAAQGRSNTLSQADILDQDQHQHTDQHSGSVCELLYKPVMSKPSVTRSAGGAGSIHRYGSQPAEMFSELDDSDSWERLNAIYTASTHTAGQQPHDGVHALAGLTAECEGRSVAKLSNLCWDPAARTPTPPEGLQMKFAFGSTHQGNCPQQPQDVLNLQDFFTRISELVIAASEGVISDVVWQHYDLSTCSLGMEVSEQPTITMGGTFVPGHGKTMDDVSAWLDTHAQDDLCSITYQGVEVC